MERNPTIEAIPTIFTGRFEGDLVVTNSGPRGIDAAKIAEEIGDLARRAQNGLESKKNKGNGKKSVYVKGPHQTSPFYYA